MLTFFCNVLHFVRFSTGGKDRDSLSEGSEHSQIIKTYVRMPDDGNKRLKIW